MKKILIILSIISLNACSQTTKSNSKTINHTINDTNMDLSKITNNTVKTAIEALQNGNKEQWYSLFADNAELYDDGNKIDFKSFSESALGHERFTSIDKVENNSLAIYGKFHSDHWGDFKTYFKFTLSNDTITKLEIGQANY